MSPAERRPVLTIVGSGTALPDAHRHSAAHHLDLGTASVLLDCGPGALHGLAEHGIDWERLSHVFVSHFHNDHVGDLAAVLFALKQACGSRRPRPLILGGPVGFAGFLERLAAALGRHVLDPGFEVRVVEVAAGAAFEDTAARFTLEAEPTPHTVESLAYRLCGPWGSIGYTGDTGRSMEVARFLAGCDVVVADCALTDPPTMEGHLSPALVAELASVAAPGLLVLTHVYPGQTPTQAAERVRGLYRGPVVAAADGTRIVLCPDGPVVDPTVNAI